MYRDAALWRRREVTIAAIGGVETVPWDIAGKLVNRYRCSSGNHSPLYRKPIEIQEKIWLYATLYVPDRKNI